MLEGQTESTDLFFPLADNMVVLAKDPEEMKASQEKLISWFRERLERAKHELSIAKTNLGVAQKNKWATRGWKRQVKLHEGRVSYYEKCIAALEAGYCIVPDFPVEVFAIRTSREYPTRNAVESNRWANSTSDQRTDCSSVGEGEYKSPEASELVSSKEVERSNGDKIERFTTWADEYKEPDFPMRTVQPQVLDATGKAMLLKIFDEIGVLPARRQRNRQRDPIVTGRIVRREGTSEIGLSFLISWWIDTRDL